MSRPTIADIALTVGVSKGAVSYALNGRPGVSDATRSRILAVARERGWRPHAAARALSGQGGDAIGLVLSRPARTLEVDPFFTQLVAGIESEISTRGSALVFQVVSDHSAEIEVYRRWWSERRVDGVLLVDVHVDDVRLPVLADLGMPVVVLGSRPPSDGVIGVWSNDGESMRGLLDYLVATGHDHVARIAGPAHLEHTAVRTEALIHHAGELGIGRCEIIDTDYSLEAGAAATREILSRREGRPSVLIYDNDIMALAGLSVTQEMGVSVPDDISIVAWDDSMLCRVVHPALTALGRDVPGFGATAARLLCDLLKGEAVRSEHVPPAQLVVRGSTARRSARVAGAR